VFVALQLAKESNDPNGCVVAILCDTGERYLSKLFNDEWMRENQMIETARVTAEQLLAAKPESTPDLVTVAPSHTVRQALNLMGTYNVSQIPIVESGDCVGSLAEGSLMAQAIATPDVLDKSVQEVMEAPYPVVDGEFPLDDFSELLSRETQAVLIRQSGELSGIVTRYDVLHQVAGIS
jgi:cystathionine beta-synthase